jgi:hypothetical protein
MSITDDRIERALALLAAVGRMEKKERLLQWWFINEVWTVRGGFLDSASGPTLADALIALAASLEAPDAE